MQKPIAKENPYRTAKGARKPRLFRHVMLRNLIHIAFAELVLFAALMVVWHAISNPFLKDFKTGIFMVFLFIALVLMLVLLSLQISAHSQRLYLYDDEIVYSYGLFFKHRASIPAWRIRSCEIYSGPIQRLCHTATLFINTTGDLTEIEFDDIEFPEHVEKFIRQLCENYE